MKITKWLFFGNESKIICALWFFINKNILYTLEINVLKALFSWILVKNPDNLFTWFLEKNTKSTSGVPHAELDRYPWIPKFWKHNLNFVGWTITVWKNELYDSRSPSIARPRSSKGKRRRLCRTLLPRTYYWPFYRIRGKIIHHFQWKAVVKIFSLWIFWVWYCYMY